MIGPGAPDPELAGLRRAAVCAAPELSLSLSIYIYICIIYAQYIYIEREREIDRYMELGGEREGSGGATCLRLLV